MNRSHFHISFRAAMLLTATVLLVGVAPGGAEAAAAKPAICLGANNGRSLGNNVYTETANSGACYPNLAYQGKYKSVSGAAVWVRYNNINAAGLDYITATTTSYSYVLANPFYNDPDASAPVQLCQWVGGFPLCQSPYSNYGF